MTAVNAVPALRGARPGTWFRLGGVEATLVPAGRRRYWRVSWMACSSWWSRSLAAGRLGWRKSAQCESGAVAVEAALVLPLIMTMLLGIIDLGLSVHANVGSAAAVRAGARVASSEPRLVGFAEHAASATVRAGTGLALADIDEIWVYRANTFGFPGSDTSFPATCPAQCIRYRLSPSGDPVLLQGSWDHNSIDACVGTAHDVGVRISAEHRSLAGGVIGPTRISQHAVMRFEPTVSGRCRP